MTFYVSIIYELGGCSFYGLLLPPPGLLHHPAISLVLSPLLSHIVPKVLIFPPLSRRIDKSCKLISLACVFLSSTPIHLTDGFLQNYTSRTIRHDESYLSLLAKLQHFIKTSKRGMHNDMRCIPLDNKDVHCNFS